MSFVNCPECNSTVNERSPTCPQCGCHMPQEQKLKPPTSQDKKLTLDRFSTDDPKKGCLVWIVIILVVYFGWKMIAPYFEPEPPLPDPIFEKVPISAEELVRNAAERDSINAAERIKTEKEELRFLKTKAGKIYSKHPEWSKEECQRIADNMIWIGMHYDMLVLERGKPDHLNVSNYGKGQQYQACWDGYSTSCFYFGENRLVKSYN